jgi:hypothetical protein
MTGTDSVTLSPTDKNAIKAFVKGGGTLVVDAAGGSKRFYVSMHQHIRDMFGGSALKPLNVNSKIFSRSKSPIKQVRYRIASRKRIESNAVQLQAVTLNGRNAVILSREDITSGLLGHHSGVVDGYEPESAYAIMRNVVMTSK